MTERNKSRQLGALRELKRKRFDYLAGVLFNQDYSVFGAAIIPRAVVLKIAKYQERTNSHRFLLTDDVWGIKGVKNVTGKLQAVKF